MGLEGFSFALHEALLSIRRNTLMSLVATSTVAVCLFFLAGVSLLSVNMDHMAGTFESHVHLRVYVVQGTDQKVIKELEAKIDEVEFVDKVTYVSKEAALERMRKQFGDQKDLLAGIESTNPLPDSFEVRVDPPQKIKDVALVVEKIKGVEKVQFRQEIVDKLFSLTAAVRGFGIALVIVMGSGALFIMSNTIRITVFSRRREVGIMKLVGATDSLIRGPFLIEGLILGFVGSVVAAVAIFALYTWLFGVVTSNLPFLPLLTPQPLLVEVAMALLAAGAFIGGAGSTVSLRRYLRV